MYDQIGEISNKPMLYVSNDQIKEVGTMAIGEEYEMLVKVKVKNLSINDDGYIGVSLEIEDVMMPETEDPDKMSAKDYVAYSRRKFKV